MDSSQLFKALSDLTRLRCLVLLVNDNELCVCELIYAMDLPQPKISHHLAALRKAGLVKDRKVGLRVYYRISESLSSWALEVLRATAKGIADDEPFIADSITLQNMPNRPIEALSA